MSTSPSRDIEQILALKASFAAILECYGWLSNPVRTGYFRASARIIKQGIGIEVQNLARSLVKGPEHGVTFWYQIWGRKVTDLEWERLFSTEWLFRKHEALPLSVALSDDLIVLRNAEQLGRLVSATQASVQRICAHRFPLVRAHASIDLFHPRIHRKTVNIRLMGCDHPLEPQDCESDLQLTIAPTSNKVAIEQTFQKASEFLGSRTLQVDEIADIHLSLRPLC